MSDLPPESPAFEIRPRLNEEMEYFKEMALQETERWIESVTKKCFKYPDNPRKSLQDGILLCELVNALKPGCVRKINRFPTPIAFLDNLTVFQNACRCDFGLQESQLFDIKDLEDLSLRGVLESEEDIQYETSKRLKNVVITVFWLGKAVRRWYKGPMLDFSVFTDIIDMSHSSQASFRTPSEASFVSSGRLSMDWYSSPRTQAKQSEMAYERVAKYLESGPVYGSQASLDYQEPASQYGIHKMDGTRMIGSDLEDDILRDNILRDDFPGKSNHSTGGQDLNRKSQLSGPGQFTTNYPRNLVDPKVKVKSPPRTPQRTDRLRSPASPASPTQTDGIHSPISPGTPTRTDALRSPTSPGTTTLHSPLQFVKGDSNALTETAKQTLQLLQQQSSRKDINLSEDEDWEAKLKDWKARRRSQRASETDDISIDIGTVIRSESSLKAESKREKDSCTISPVSSEDLAVQNSPSKTVIKRREQEEDMLALFGFTRIPDKTETKTKPFMRPEEEIHRDKHDRKSVEDSFVIKSPDVTRNELQKPSGGGNAGTAENHHVREQPITTSLNVSLQKNSTASVTDLEEPNKKFVEKVIKISQRPMHQKGFGFTIKGGKESGMPITVDKVHLGGAADVCDLASKDEIVAINGALLANHYLESVRAVIDQAVHCGQVELTIRRMLGSKSFDETESDVFSEEDLEYGEEQTEDSTEEKLSEMLEHENARPLTPVPPEDEPPPLPAAPPPLPKWSTFPGTKAPFAPAEDIAFFEDEPGHGTIHTDAIVLGSGLVDEFDERTSKKRVSEKEETTVQHLPPADPEKYSMLMKRIHFFGLKPEESEEYKQILEGKNTKQLKPELPEISQAPSVQPVLSPKKLSVQSEERVFALFVSPLEKQTSPSASCPPPSHTSLPSVAVNIDGSRNLKESEKIERGTYEDVGKVEMAPRGTEDKNGFSAEKEVNKERFLIEDVESGKGFGAKSSTVLKEDRAVKKVEISGGVANQNARLNVDIPEIASSAKDEPQSLLREKPRNVGLSDTQHRHSENLSQSFEKSKGWRSMEMLRSFSVSDAVKIDPTERAREDYLSLMMSCQKPNLGLINRQYFDIDKDLKRMEEWNKKQEQLRKERLSNDLDINQNWNYSGLQEKFDHDKEELQRKHESALQEATAVGMEKQKHEDQMLETEIQWKHYLEKVHAKRQKEMEKKHKEDQLRQKLAEEKAKKKKVPTATLR